VIDLQFARVNLVMAATAKHDQILCRVLTALFVFGDVVQFKDAEPFFGSQLPNASGRVGDATDHVQFGTVDDRPNMSAQILPKPFLRCGQTLGRIVFVYRGHV
jgi:hypothetical protein